MPDKFRVRVQRQDGPQTAPYSQTFELEYKPDMNVISVLQDIAAHPVTVDGAHTTPVVWDCNCLEEVCGACSMRINGVVRQACSALVDELLQAGAVIDLKPMTKFPLVRDLFTDRSWMFNALKKVRAWIPVDSYAPLGGGPIVPPEINDRRYDLSRCMTCGCCMEACPQFNPHSQFIGPQVIPQVVLFNMHPTGAMTATVRNEAMMGPGGITDCGNAQNCSKVCPKSVPITWAIGKLGRDTTTQAIKRWLLK
jgi:succinate dehydrogenase / fumarate reductase, iron-sulfur subunit